MNRQTRIVKPFSLEELNSNPNLKVETRKGNKVRILCTDKRDSDGYNIVALMELTSNKNLEAIEAYQLNGHYYSSLNISDYDLVLVEYVKSYKIGDRFKYKGSGSEIQLCLVQDKILFINLSTGHSYGHELDYTKLPYSKGDIIVTSENLSSMLPVKYDFNDVFELVEK